MSLVPQCIRMSFGKLWKSFATYNLDEDIDLSAFRVADAGDVEMHTTDILSIASTDPRSNGLSYSELSEYIDLHDWRRSFDDSMRDSGD